VLALSGATSAQAQEESLLTTVLGGVVDGFTGANTEELWGWMLGGGQSAGIDAISSELDTIESTLTTIANDLSEIEEELQELNCGFDVDFITQYAGPIQSYYQTYANWLTDMQDGALPVVDDVSEWANCAVGFPTEGQTCAIASGTDILTLMDDLNDAATATAGADGSISDCIKVKGGPCPEFDRRSALLHRQRGPDHRLVPDHQHPGDDRPDRGLSFSGLADRGLTLVQQRRRDLPQRLPDRLDARGCVQPITVYTSQFLAFTKAQLQAGGAPLSTCAYVIVNGNDYLLARSIEQYNVAADPYNTTGCVATEPGQLTSAPGIPCGATAGKYNDPFLSVASGPYGYGSGTWTPAQGDTFADILGVEYGRVAKLVEIG